MKKRKQIIMDKKYQHGKSRAITSFAALVTAFVIIAVGGTISINNKRIAKNNEKIAENSRVITGIIHSQQNIFIKYSLIPRNGAPGPGKSDLMVKDYNANVEKLNKAIAGNKTIISANEKIMSMNTWLIVVILLIATAGMGLLYWRLIHETHRVSGPIFVMSRHIRELLNDETPDMRDLRDNDEFKDFYDLFRQLAKRFLERKK